MIVCFLMGSYRMSQNFVQKPEICEAIIQAMLPSPGKCLPFILSLVLPLLIQTDQQGPGVLHL